MDNQSNTLLVHIWGECCAKPKVIWKNGEETQARVNATKFIAKQNITKALHSRAVVIKLEREKIVRYFAFEKQQS